MGTYIPTNQCYANAYLPGIGIYITLASGSSSGTFSLYTGGNILNACAGTPANQSFSFGNCFAVGSLGSIILQSSSTQFWQTTSTYYSNAGNCGGSLSAFAGDKIFIGGVGCLATNCTCSFGICTQSSCQTSQPGLPSGLAGATAYYDSQCTVINAIGGTATGCLSNNATGVFAVSLSVSCSGNTFNTTVYSGSSTCSGGLSVTASITGGCTQLPGTNLWYQISCGGTCFHRDTEISYKDEKLTLDSLKKGEHPSCSVPHIYNSRGIKIATSCSDSTLRLTPDHLVYTQRGLIQAESVKTGDLLFQDMEESIGCKVTSIEEESHETYFGLNCEDSVVLADGYKTSTFGKLHFVPSLWMRIMSRIFGVSYASSLGDYLFEFFQRWKLI